MFPTPSPQPRLRVMHMASGGFSGATQVALDLTLGGQAHHDTLLVLRSKRRTPQDRVQRLRQQGVPLALLPGWSHAATVWALRGLCHEWKPDIVVGHGFPEHLLARWAAHWAGVPHLVQVEHNMRERYTAFKRWQVSQLAPHTEVFVGVSDAVSGVLRGMGLPAARVQTIRNGTHLDAYASSEQQVFEHREPAILMAARFGAQKDHETLIRSLVPLAERHGLRPPLRLAGGGSKRHLERAQALAASLGVQSQVEFLGHRSDVPQLLMRHQVAALSTHYEGLPLSLAEAMAAGCAVLGSDVAAVRETLGNGQWGALPAAGDPEAWADALAAVWQQPQASAERASQARAHARQHLTRERMVQDYAALFDRLMGRLPDRLTDLVSDRLNRGLHDLGAAPSAQSAGQVSSPPWLSVLIPAHNPGPYLDEALQSVMPQLDASCELIVFNDASTDDTPAVLDRLQAQGNRAGGPVIRVLHQDTSVGVSEARNGLLDAASGQWLWFLDADDRLRAGAVALLKAVTYRHADLQAVVVAHAVLRSAVRLKHRLGGEAHRRSLPQAGGPVHARSALMSGLLAKGQWHVWGKVLRRDAWPESLRFPSRRVFEDLSVVPRLMAGIDRAWYLAEPLVEYRSNPGSILGSMNRNKVCDWAQALEDLLSVEGFDHAWAAFVAQQALRMVRVAQRMDLRLGAEAQQPGGSAIAGSANWVDAWWHQLCARSPAVRHAARAWVMQPRRWADVLLARRRGWLQAGTTAA